MNLKNQSPRFCHSLLPDNQLVWLWHIGILHFQNLCLSNNADAAMIPLSTFRSCSCHAGLAMGQVVDGFRVSLDP